VAREVVVERGGQTSRFALAKVDRAKLYGTRRRVPLDPAGQPCTRAELTSDGALLIRTGMTAQGYFDEQGLWYAASELKGIRGDGTEAPFAESTLGVSQPVERVNAQRLLDSRVESVYALDAEALDPSLKGELEAGGIFQFHFNYRAGYAPPTAFLVANATGIYALVARPFAPDWCSLEQVATEDFSEDDGLDDDLDFEMF